VFLLLLFLFVATGIMIYLKKSQAARRREDDDRGIDMIWGLKHVSFSSHLVRKLHIGSKILHIKVDRRF